MRKRDELVNTSSCLNKAKEHEMLFVLLGRDAAAPVAVRAWIGERLRTGKNQPNDTQILEAESCANAMEIDRFGVKDNRLPNSDDHIQSSRDIDDKHSNCS